MNKSDLDWLDMKRGELKRAIDRYQRCEPMTDPREWDLGRFLRIIGEWQSKSPCNHMACMGQTKCIWVEPSLQKPSDCYTAEELRQGVSGGTYPPKCELGRCNGACMTEPKCQVCRNRAAHCSCYEFKPAPPMGDISEQDKWHKAGYEDGSRDAYERAAEQAEYQILNPHESVQEYRTEIANRIRALARGNKT